MTETPARTGCTCDVPAGFGAERRHVATNPRCALNRSMSAQRATSEEFASVVDELGQVRLLLQAAGYGHLRPSAGVRALITDGDLLRAEKARAMAAGLYAAPGGPVAPADTSWIETGSVHGERVPLWRRIARAVRP